MIQQGHAIQALLDVRAEEGDVVKTGSREPMPLRRQSAIVDLLSVEATSLAKQAAGHVPLDRGPVVGHSVDQTAPVVDEDAGDRLRVAVLGAAARPGIGMLQLDPGSGALQQSAPAVVGGVVHGDELIEQHALALGATDQQVELHVSSGLGSPRAQDGHAPDHCLLEVAVV